MCISTLCVCVCVSDLRKQMESSELRNQRLKEVFQRKIQEFRTVCYLLTGYQIDITTENQYRLSSVYAEHMDDSLLFKKVQIQHNKGCGTWTQLNGSLNLLKRDLKWLWKNLDYIIVPCSVWKPARHWEIKTLPGELFSMPVTAVTSETATKLLKQTQEPIFLCTVQAL